MIDFIDPTTIEGAVVYAIIYLVTFFAYAHSILALSGLGNIGLASVGALSVITGLAAQNTLGNLIAGISLLIYRPFIVGDRLQVTAPAGLETAVVESLTLGYTLLKTDDNRRVVCSLPVTITHDSDMDKARAILLELVGKNPRSQGINGCPVTSLDGLGVVLTLSVWSSDSVEAAGLRCELLEGIKRRFAHEGIKIPNFERAVVIK